MKRGFVFGAALLSMGNAAVARAAAPIDVESLKTVTRTLASDDFGGRLPGSPGATRTVAFIIAEMRAAGLQPGYRGKWTQDVPLVTLTPASDTALRISGKAGALRFAQGTDAILWSKVAKPQVDLVASNLVFVGYGIDAPERGWNDYAGIDVRGKTVVILVNDPDWQAKDDVGPFGGRRLTYYGRYTYKFEEAARHGAAGALIVHDAAAAGYPFQVLVNTNAGPKIDIDTAATAPAHARLEGWLTTDAAARLLTLAGHSLPDLVAAAQRRGFKAVPLALTASSHVTNRIERSISQNVVGLLPGRRTPDEAFLYSAHWDHLGSCPPVDGHAICDGAIDDASGVAGLLALARSFAGGPRPSRSILFLALTSEEQGLLGSAYYARSPGVPLREMVGGINIDVMNVFGPTRDVMILHPGLSSLEPLFIKAATAQGRRLSPEMTPGQGLYYRSDQLSFARGGVPMLFASSGFDYLSAPAGQGLPGYFQHVYHTARDRYDPNWNWAGAVADLELYRDVGTQVADSALWPRWTKSAEFHRPASAGRGRAEESKQ